MNYGKEPLEKKRQHIASQKRMKKKRVGVRLFHAILICCLLVVILGTAAVGLLVKQILDNTPQISADDIIPKGYASFVYAEDGTLLEKFSGSGSNRIYQEIEELPDYFGKAFVAVEDERFYQHKGIDPQGILRAGVRTVLSGFRRREGASTITQQLIKNNVFPDFVNEETFMDSLERKLQEQVLALNIEKQMDKDDILEAYMNTINLGQGCYGVQAASQRYFGKNASELTVSEVAVIAGIAQNPYGYDPTIFPEDNAERRDVVLEKLRDQGYISQEQYDEAKADDVYARIQVNAPAEETTPYSYYNDALFMQLTEDLMELKGFTDRQAQDYILNAGLNITSAQNTWVQWICDEEANNPDIYSSGTEYGVDFALTVYHSDGREADNYSKQMFGKYIMDTRGCSESEAYVFPTPEAAYAAIDEYKSTLGITEDDLVDDSNVSLTLQPQTSVVVMDPYTGKVLAIVGGRGEKTGSLSMNRATATTNQPGSCFKVLSTYAPAVDSCGYTLATTIDDDGPFVYANGVDKATNWDHRYNGPTTVRRAIAHSINVCALKTLTAIGPKTGFDYLEQFGFTTLVEMDENGYTDIQQATALGGITRGITNLEMTAAYAAIANAGMYNKPILYTKVTDHDGNVLIDNTTPKSHRVLKETTAALLTQAMSDVFNSSYGTATSAALPNMPEAGKTGTTEYSQDLWLEGFTPYYITGVWGGYDDNKPMADIYSQSWHMKLWKNIMTRLHEDVPYKDFTIPAGVKRQTVCSKSGKLAGEHCEETITEYFAIGTVPNDTCEICEEEWQKAEEERLKQEEEEKKKQEEEDKKNQEENGGSSGGSGDSGGSSGGNSGGSGNSPDDSTTPSGAPAAPDQAA